MATNTKTPIMVLQELAMKKGFGTPDYQITFSICGSHENRFDFVVSIAGIQAKGSGSSKQIAKHQAAHNALMQLKERGLYIPSENPVAEFNVPLRDESSPFKSAINCIVHLQNICIENKIPAPVFDEISSVGPPHAKEFTYECKIASIKTEAKANTKKMAKQLAAKEMVERIKDVIPTLAEEEPERCNNTLTEIESQAKSRYNELRDVIPDKSVKIDDIPNTLKKLMDFRNLTYEDFVEDLSNVSEESLKSILDKLELTYEMSTFQEVPPLVVLNLSTDTPFVMIGSGNTLAEAAQIVLERTFTVMKCYMQLEL